MNKYSTIGVARPSFKNLAIYMFVLIIVSLVLLSTRYSAENSIVIYAQQLGKSDFMQVFFPVEGSYNESNSKRSIVFGHTERAIKIILPDKSISHVRIDPANAETKVLIKKIRLKYKLGSRDYYPDDLVAYSRAIQMIEKLEVTPNGLVVHSAGADPVFELQLQIPSFITQLTEIFVISLILSIVVFWLIIKLGEEKSKLMILAFKQYLLSVPATVYLIAIPFFASLMIITIFYPGAMSYDTLHGLRGARNGVTDSIWPPMVSYVWRTIDLISLNPSAMHFSQVFLLLISVFYVVYAITKKVSYAIYFLMLFLAIPVILGTLAVIWKDVLMASFFIASLALIMILRSVKIKWQFYSLSALAVLTLFIAICSRHNAITGAVPLIFYLSFIIGQYFNFREKKLWLSVFILGSFITGATFGGKTILDTHSLPSFDKMNNETSRFLQGTRVLDIAGASLCVGKNLYADDAQHISLSEIEMMYDPKHVNLSAQLFSRPEFKTNIDDIWWNVALNHPICIFNNKYNLTRYMIGANENGQFLITHPRIDENEFGYVFEDSSIRDAAFAYVGNVSHIHIVKPWFIYLLSIFSFFYLLRIKALSTVNFTIFMSGCFYFGGLVMFGNAADARLLFYTTTTLSIFTFVSVLEIMKWIRLDNQSHFTRTDWA